MYCKNCGADLKPGAERCRRCGAPVPPPGESPKKKKFFEREKDGEAKKKPEAAIGKFFWPVLCLVLVIVILILIVFRPKASQTVQAPAQPTAPVETVAAFTAEPEPTASPAPSWASVYKSFLEGDPTVNCQLIPGAAEMGLEGTFTAQLFSLADLDGDAQPELLLAKQPEKLPGWNVSCDLGEAVEQFVVCTIKEGRVSPITCFATDFELYPLALSVGNSWILTQHQGEGSDYSMEYTKLTESGKKSLRFEFSIEQRTNSLGRLWDQAVERYYIDGERVSYWEFARELAGEGATEISYSPIYFKSMAPGCLESMESDWYGRASEQLDIRELNRLRGAAGQDRAVKELPAQLDMISQPYCISLVQYDSNWVMILGVDQGNGYEYLREIEISSVSCSDGQAWVDSSNDKELAEGSVLEYVVGISPDGELEQPFTITTNFVIKLYDGSQMELSLNTVFPQE